MIPRGLAARSFDPTCGSGAGVEWGRGSQCGRQGGLGRGACERNPAGGLRRGRVPAAGTADTELPGVEESQGLWEFRGEGGGREMLTWPSTGPVARELGCGALGSYVVVARERQREDEASNWPFGCLSSAGTLGLVMSASHVSYDRLCRRFGNHQDPPVHSEVNRPHFAWSRQRQLCEDRRHRGLR